MRIFKILSISVFLIMLFIYVNSFSGYVMPWQKKEVIETALLWGGLSELPKNAEIISLEKRGSMFTTQFIIEFSCSKTEIEKWIHDSKRLRNNIPKNIRQIKTYKIYPGESESLGGKVEITGNKVLINMSWS